VYKVLVESAQKINVIIEEDQAGEDSEYFNDLFIKDSLEAKGINHVQFVRICLEERAELVRDTLLEMEHYFTGYFTRGKPIPDAIIVAICRSKVKCKELLDYAYSYRIGITGGPSPLKR
jgi:hypothetical protein